MCNTCGIRAADAAGIYGGIGRVLEDKVVWCIVEDAVRGTNIIGGDLQSRGLRTDHNKRRGIFDDKVGGVGCIPYTDNVP